MTPAGYASMKAQLLKLKNVDRPANSRAIEIARGHGDLSENADYSAAKEEQGLIEAKIRELEAKVPLPDRSRLPVAAVVQHVDGQVRGRRRYAPDRRAPARRPGRRRWRRRARRDVAG